MLKLSRRGLVRGAAGLAAGYWAGRLFPDDCYPALADTLSEPNVIVAEGTDQDSPEVLLRTALDPLGGIARFVKPGQTVAIKPNATWANPPHTASSTDPDLLRAMINMVKAAGAARVIIVDRSVFDPPAMLLDISGLGTVIEETGAESCVLDRFVEPKSKYTDIQIPKGVYFKNIGVVKAAVEADVRINMAVAKTHIVVPLTLCCKHMMGFLENPPGLHASLDQGIADIGGAPAIKPVLYILEAIRIRVRGAAYGDGTDITDPARVKRINKLLAGTDPVLIDAYATASFFGRAPMELTHLKRCFEAGLGEIDVQKAAAAGLVRSYKPGDWKPTPTPTATATATPRPEETATRIFLPTTTPVPTVAPTSAPKRRIIGDELLALDPILDAPLVPLAVVIGGVGMVVGRRLVGGLQQPAVPEAAEPTPPAKQPPAGAKRSGEPGEGDGTPGPAPRRATRSGPSDGAPARLKKPRAGGRRDR